MNHRLVLFKWTETEEKIALDIVEESFNSLHEATKALDEIDPKDYDLAKVFLGDALLHTRDKRQHGGGNFS